DMFVIAAREPLTEISPQEARSSLLGSASQRMALALLDLDDAKKDAEEYQRLLGEERAAKLTAEAQRLDAEPRRTSDELMRIRTELQGVESERRRMSDELGRIRAELARVDSERRRTAAELVRAFEGNERIQLRLCRMRLRELELEGRLGTAEPGALETS